MDNEGKFTNTPSIISVIPVLSRSKYISSGRSKKAFGCKVVKFIFWAKVKMDNEGKFANTPSLISVIPVFIKSKCVSLGRS